MSREKELVKSTAVIGLGKLLPRFVSLITLPILTACFTKSQYGSYDLITTMVALLMPFATLQIQAAAFRFLIECRKDHVGSSEIISNIYMVVVPVSFVVSVGVFIFMPEMDAPTRFAVAVYFFLDSIEITAAQIARGLGKTKVFAVSSIVLSVVNGLGIVAALKMIDSGLLGVVWSLALANAVAFIYLSIRTRIWTFIKLNMVSKSKLKELLSYSWPIVPNALSNWILKLSDRLVITGFMGVEANAVYAVANKIPNLLSIAHTVLIMAWQENASIAVKDQDASEYYTKMFDKILRMMAGATALLIAFTPVLFALLIKGDYDDAYVQMPILVLAMFFYVMSAFQGGIYVAHKKTKSIGVTTILAALINLLIDLIFVNLIGITAGSISTLVAYMFLYFYRMYDLRKFQPMKINVRTQVICLAIIVGMLFLCFLRIWYLDAINMALGIVVFCVMNKDLILTVMKKMKKMFRRRKSG